MIYRLLVPTTIEDNDAVRVLEWHISPGDAVATNALIVELETHKALIEVHAEQAGVLRARCLDEDEWCPLGGTLAILSDTADEPIDGAHAALPASFLVS